MDVRVNTKRLVSFLVVVALGAMASPATATHSAGGFIGSLVTLNAPAVTNPYGIAASPDGTYVWYTDRDGDQVGRHPLAPPGVGGRFSAPEISSPEALIVGIEGSAIFSMTDSDIVGRIAPDGTVTTRDHFSLYNPNAFAMSDDGDIWIADLGIPEGGIAGGLYRLYYIESAGHYGGIDREFTRAGARLAGVATPGDGFIWYTDIWHDEVSIQPPGAPGAVHFRDGVVDPRSIVEGPDGNVWFINKAGQSIGRITRQAGETGITLVGDYYSDPRLSHDLRYDIPLIVGPDGNLWFSNSHSLVRVEMNGTMSFFNHPDIDSIDGLAPGPDGNIWFTDNQPRGGIHGFFDPASATFDFTAPTASPTVAPPPNTAGWHNTAVTVTWNWVDEPGGSGIDTQNCDASDTSAFEGAAVQIVGHCKDIAGNEGIADATVSIDTTPPSVEPVFSPDPVVVGGAASVSPGATDALSGVASQSCGALDTATVGTKSVTCSATDHAGNTTEVTVDYEVVYDFGGFGAPLDDGAAYTDVKAGQVVSITFRITDGNDNPITDLEDTDVAVTVTTIDCELGASDDNTSETAAGRSALLHLGDGTYRWNWKTSRDYANSCKRMHLSLGDGGTHTADFHFTR